jgi:hypothetical protein
MHQQYLRPDILQSQIALSSGYSSSFKLFWRNAARKSQTHKSEGDNQPERLIPDCFSHQS